MTDKEVGEMWRKHQAQLPYSFSSGEVLSVIRKLVEERAKIIARDAIMLRGEREPDLQRSVDAALRYFGIDPKEWK